MVDANSYRRIRRYRFGLRSLFASLRERAGLSGRAHHQGQKCPEGARPFVSSARHVPLASPVWTLASTANLNSAFECRQSLQHFGVSWAVPDQIVFPDLSVAKQQHAFRELRDGLTVVLVTHGHDLSRSALEEFP